LLFTVSIDREAVTPFVIGVADWAAFGNPPSIADIDVSIGSPMATVV
jgi:hypothetical protein